MKRGRDPTYYSEALRGRILLVFQDKWRGFFRTNPVHGMVSPGPAFSVVPWAVPVCVIARELGVSRQSVYRACPELVRRCI